MSQYPQAMLPFGQSPDLSPLRENFAPRIGGPITDLNQQELQQNKQIGQERLMNQANQLQNAHAMQVAKGQTSTSTSGMGTSPITQSVMKAKQLATSMLDQDNLSDQQKGILRDMTNDPNVDYKTHLQAIDQMRTSQQQGQHQGNFETKNSEMQARQQQQQGMQKQRMNLQAASQGERAAAKQADAAKTALAKQGIYDLDTPNKDSQLEALRQQYIAAQGQVTASQKAHDDLLNNQSSMMPGGDGSEQDQHGAEFGGGSSQAMEQQGYKPGTASITKTDTSYPFDRGGGSATQDQLKNQGKMTVDHARAYLQQAGGDRAKAQALAKKDGWSW